MTKQLLVLGCLCLLAMSCTKTNDPVVETATALSKTDQADAVYHYQGQAYPLHFQTDAPDEFLQDESYLALQAATAESSLVTFTYSDRPKNHVYLFDSEFEGYDYMEKNNASPLLGRKFKVSLRIDELREALMTQFGTNLDFKNAAVAAAAQAGVAAIYEELHINLPFPDDIAAFVGVVTDGFKRQKTGSAMASASVLTVWEHSNFRGSEMHVDQAPNTVLWNYGNFDCFTMAANPDLTLELQTNGNNWNDCISSKCLSYIQGADAMGEGYYKDAFFGVYTNGHQVAIYNNIGTSTHPLCYNMRNYLWFHPNGWGGNMNDQVSSIRVKAV